MKIDIEIENAKGDPGYGRMTRQSYIYFLKKINDFRLNGEFLGMHLYILLVLKSEKLYPLFVKKTSSEHREWPIRYRAVEWTWQ